jgi:hypothetical protein
MVDGPTILRTGAVGEEIGARSEWGPGETMGSNRRSYNAGQRPAHPASVFAGGLGKRWVPTADRTTRASGPRTRLACLRGAWGNDGFQPQIVQRGPAARAPG